MIYSAGMASREKRCLATNFTAVVPTKSDDIEQIFEVVLEEKDIDWEKFTSFGRMTRIFAYCFSFQSKIKGKKSRQKNCSKSS